MVPLHAAVHKICAYLCCPWFHAVFDPGFFRLVEIPAALGPKWFNNNDDALDMIGPSIKTAFNTREQ